MLETNYVISQIFVILAYTSFAFTYLTKNKIKILFLNTGYGLFTIVAFFLLGAYSGLAVVLLSLVRNVFLFFQEKGKIPTKFNPVFFITIYLASAVIAITTYIGPLGLLPVFAELIYTFSIWQKNNRVYLYLGVFESMIWVAYGFFIVSVFSVALEFILLSIIIARTISEVCKEKRAKKYSVKLPE